MPVKVNDSYGKGGSGLMSSPALRIGEVVGGAMTGDPMLVAGGLTSKGSPAGQAIGMANTAKKFSSPNAPPPTTSDATQMVAGGPMDDDQPTQYDYAAVTRRLNSSNSNRTA